ncbi:hypothetical protein BDP27DRAFT_1451601 [Rhodocollybia butyracea]|uniref:Uncharacterized protein n=1 Tax=Rhodocollybia butyracea TaxID=206335 RepID=A0A9P5PBX9_9AGAR|nr:hypothetical protein BDP27DRAFT_1451601 [Rhodocollybia butyracea]
MLNYDVIMIICVEIESRFLTEKYRKDLLSLGLASKKFLEPALDVLWKDIGGIEPLLSVLPETTLINGQKMLVQPIAPSSWDRLHFYTSRVRAFKGPWDAEGMIHDSVYAYLSQGTPIFPNLKRLEPSYQLCSSNSYTLFLATRLQVVSWPDSYQEDDASYAESDLGPSLALLVSTSPGLKSLTLDQYIYSRLTLSLSTLRSLEILLAYRLPHLEMDFIQAIALLPKLTDLSLTLPAGILLDYAGVESGFPSLTELELRGSTFDTRIFLAVVRPKALRDLAVSWTVMDHLLDISAITRILSSFHCLRGLEIDGEDLLPLPPDLDELRLWSIFEPLLELKWLERLRYNIPLPVSDQKTVRISSAWPRIKALDLYSADGLSSFESLVHFARHCPDLRSLSYPIDFETIKPKVIVFSTMIPPTLSPHPLRFFHIHNEVNHHQCPRYRARFVSDLPEPHERFGRW